MKSQDRKEIGNHLIFRVVEYGLEHEYFTINQIINALGLQDDLNSKEYIRHTLVSRINVSDNVNHLIVKVKTVPGETEDDQIYTLLPNAIIQYVDYLEIVEAKRMAKAANLNANAALSITVYAIIISVVLGIGQLIFQVVEAYLRM